MKKPILFCALLFGITSIAQTTSSDFFVSEGTPMVGLENIHVQASITQKTISLDSISITSEHLVNEKEEIAKVQCVKKQQKKPIAQLLNKPKTTTVATATHSVVLKTQNNQQSSSIFSTENAPFCSTNTTPELNKKHKLFVAPTTLVFIFSIQRKFLYNLCANAGVQEVKCKRYFCRPPPIFLC